MSGKKRAHVLETDIISTFEIQQIKKVRKELAAEKSKNRDLSAKVTKTEQNLTQQRAELKNAFKKIKKTEQNLTQQKQAISKLYNQVCGIQKQEKDSMKYAEKWLNLIEEQNKILGNLEMNRFFNKEYSNYVDQIRNITKNIKNGQYQAAIALSQDWHTILKHDMPHIEQVYTDGKELEFELEASFEQLSCIMQNKIFKREFDIEGGKKEVENIDISYWAEDEWKQTEQIFQKIKSQIQDLHGLDLKKMQKLEKQIDEAVEKFNNANKLAEIRFINYIRKMNMQESIAEKMFDRGFEIVDNIFQYGDNRKNNILLMENERGEKILINIGDENEKIDMEINFNSLDPLTHTQRLQSIMQAVGAKDYQTSDGYEAKPAEEKFFDLKRYTQKQVGTP